MAAIYQWFPTWVAVEVLTTTLYPIEVYEYIDFSASLQLARMETIPSEDLDVAGEIIQFTIESVLYDLPLLDEAIDVAGEIQQFTIETVLFQLPLLDEAIDVAGEIMEFVIIDKLISGLMPDEGIDFKASLVSASMTDV